MNENNVLERSKQLIKLDSNIKLTLMLITGCYLKACINGREGKLGDYANALNKIVTKEVVSLIMIEKNSDEMKKAQKLVPEINELFNGTIHNTFKISESIDENMSVYEDSDYMYKVLVGIKEIAFAKDEVVRKDINEPELDEIGTYEADIEEVDLEDFELDSIEYDDFDSDDYDKEYGDNNYEDEELVEEKVEQSNEKNDTEVLSDDEIDEMELESHVMRIMNVYEDLYSVGFELKRPFGIMTNDGYITISSGKRVFKRQSFLGRFYTIMENATRNKIIQSTTNSETIADKNHFPYREGTMYYPNFQMDILYGEFVRDGAITWDKVYATAKERLKKVVKEAMKHKKNINSVVNALTTSVVISEYDINAGIKLRINIGTMGLSCNALVNEFNKQASTIFSGNGKVFRSDTSRSGVIELDIVFDMQAFTGKPLFAYTAVDSMRRNRRPIDLKHVIVGEASNGKTVTYDLDSQAHSVIIIGAGQRSGKGVLTLNLTGTMLANRCPMIYFDCKPDMSTVIRQVAGNQKVAVYDSLANYDAPSIGAGAPELIKESCGDIFGIIAYIKMVNLMCAAAQLAIDKKITFENRPFFIFDEIMALQNNMSGAMKSVMIYAKNKEKNVAEAHDWAVKMVNWMEMSESKFASTLLSQLPMSGISSVYLTQSIQPTEWSALGVDGLHCKINPFKKVITNKLSLKFLGRGTFNSEYGLSNLSKDTSISNMIENRYFAVTTCQKINAPTDVKVVKPYLVLNDHRNGTPAADEFRSVIGDRMFRLLAPDGELPVGAGYAGFMNYLGDGAVESIGLGYKFLMNVIRALGLSYNSVEEYLYDASADGLMTVGQMLNSGKPVNGESTETGDGIFENIFGSNISEHKSDEPDVKGFESNDNMKNGIPLVDTQVEADAKITPKEFYGEEERQERLDRHKVEASADRDGQFDGGYSVDKEQLSKLIHLVDVPESKVISTKLTKEMIESLRSPEVETSQDTAFESDENGNVRVDVSKSDCAYEKNIKNTIDISYKDVNGGAITRMMRTMKGAENQFANRWEAVLNSIGNSIGGIDLITRVNISEDAMFVNSSYIDLTNVLGGVADIRLEDIVNFRTLLTRCSHLKEITLSSDMLGVAYCELGEDAIIQMFNISKSLQALYEKSPDMEDNKAFRITRRDLNKAGFIKKMEQMAVESQQLAQLDTFMKVNDTRRNEESSPTKDVRLWRKSKRCSSDLMTKAKNSVTSGNSHFVKGGAFALLSAGIFLGGGLLSALGGAFGGIRKTFKRG